MDGVEALPPLRETIAAHGLDAKKRFGQHFLLDLNLTRRIARAAAPLGDGTVIEIGPGPGGLTRALLLEGAGHVVAVEVDGRAFGPLLELQAAAGGRLDLIEADALKIANATSYGLASYVWTENGARAIRMAEGIEAGLVFVNSQNVRDLRQPFGGIKGSGTGREGGHYSYEAFLEVKNVCVSKGSHHIPRWGI